MADKEEFEDIFKVVSKAEKGNENTDWLEVALIRKGESKEAVYRSFDQKLWGKVERGRYYLLKVEHTPGNRGTFRNLLDVIREVNEGETSSPNGAAPVRDAPPIAAQGGPSILSVGDQIKIEQVRQAGEDRRLAIQEALNVWVNASDKVHDEGFQPLADEIHAWLQHTRNPKAGVTLETKEGEPPDTAKKDLEIWGVFVKESGKTGNDVRDLFKGKTLPMWQKENEKSIEDAIQYAKEEWGIS